MTKWWEWSLLCIVMKIIDFCRLVVNIESNRPYVHYGLLANLCPRNPCFRTSSLSLLKPLSSSLSPQSCFSYVLTFSAQTSLSLSVPTIRVCVRPHFLCSNLSLSLCPHNILHSLMYRVQLYRSSFVGAHAVTQNRTRV
jgi:hypothetical protein